VPVPDPYTLYPVPEPWSSPAPIPTAAFEPVTDTGAPAAVVDGAQGTEQPPQAEPAQSSEWELEQYEGEVSRSSPAYTRWVQAGLNRIMGLRLAVDGVVGPKTRSGVRSFQSREGLTADGIVGPLTERQLILRGAGQPSTSSGPMPPTPTPPPSTLSALRQNIVRVALGELARWRDGAVKESDPAMRSRLADYWKTGTGSSFQEPDWWSKYPWSAAFISWVMKLAGAGSAFRYSAGHSYYIHAAKQNRLANSSNPIKAYRVTEVAPQPGDLVCKSRAGSGATYDNIQPGMSTHCDVVTEVRPGQLITVGGNVSDSVKRTPVRTNTQGHVNQSGYFAVVKVG